MNYPKNRWSAFLLLMLLSIGCTIALAQEPTPDTPVAASSADAGLDPTLKSALTPQFLETKIKEAEARTDHDEAAKSTDGVEFVQEAGVFTPIDADATQATKNLLTNIGKMSISDKARLHRQRIGSPD